MKAVQEHMKAELKAYMKEEREELNWKQESKRETNTGTSEH